jgi:hypothetical protein
LGTEKVYNKKDEDNTYLFRIDIFQIHWFGEISTKHILENEKRKFEHTNQLLAFAK